MVPPHTPTFIKCVVPFPHIAIRDSPSPTSTCYSKLSISEREQYVPTPVAEGKVTQIGVGTILNWMSVDTCLYNGSLTYVSDADMERSIVMTDDNGRAHHYDMELFKKLIPYMYGGVITGKFKYSGCGGKNIKYALVPYAMDTNSNNLLPCDSDGDD